MKSLSNQIKLEIFLPIVLVLLLCFGILDSEVHRKLLRPDHLFLGGEFIATVILGNFAHAFFFLWQLVRMPEFKDWSRGYRFYGLSFPVIVTMLFLSLWGFFYFGLELTLVFPIKNPESDFFNWSLFLITLVNANHALSQSRGLSYSYAHYAIQTDNTPESDLIHEREKSHVIERWMTRLLFVSDAVYLLFFLVLLARPISVGERVFRFLFVGTVIVGGAVLLLRASSRLGIFKSLFAIRYIPRAFFGFSPLAVYFTYGLHGLESVLLTWRMIGRSRAAKPMWLKFEMLLILFGFGVIYVFLFRPLGGALKDSSWAQPVRSGFAAFAVTHYIAEGFLYRFRNEHTRKYIAPLMKP